MYTASDTNKYTNLTSETTEGRSGNVETCGLSDFNQSVECL